MRRSATLQLLRGLAALGARPGRSSAASLPAWAAAAAAQTPARTSAAAAALQQSLRHSSSSSSGGGGGGGGEGASTSTSGRAEAQSNEAWEAVSQLSTEATRMAEEGHSAAAKKMLKDELPGLVDRFGSEDPAVGLIHNQLALWNFYDSDYAAAVEAAEAAHRVWVAELGEDSPAAAFHGIRLGMALTAAKRSEEAWPLLEKGLGVAVDNYNLHLKELEKLMPMAAGPESLKDEAPSQADDEATLANLQQQRLSVAMLEKLGRALQDAKFYRALSFLGYGGRKINEDWDANGSGALFFLEQEMTDAVTDMLRWVPPEHPGVQCALREHGRLVAQCEREGLRRLADDLQIHHQRLQDVVAEARAAAAAATPDPDRQDG